MLAAAVILAIMAAAAIQRVRLDRAVSVSAVERENSNLALTLGEQNSRALRNVQESLRALADAMAHAIPIERSLVAMDRGVVNAVLYVDRAGTLHRLDKESTSRASESDRDFFAWHRDHDSNDLFVGRAIRARVDGVRSIPVSIRVNRADGSFDGVLVAYVRPDYFTGLYDQPDLGAHGQIMLLGTDGYVRAATKPEPGAASADELRNSTLIRLQKTHPDGHFLSDGSPDGVARFISYYTLPEYPSLIVSVSRAESEVLAAHRHRTLLVATLFPLASLVVLLLAWLTWFTIERERRHVHALSRSEARYRKAAAELGRIIDESLDAICTFDREGRFLHASAGCRRVWGYEPEELVGREALSMVHPDDRDKTLEAMSRVIAGQPTRAFENRHRRRDGGIAWLMWSARWLEDDQAMFCVARDITEAKLMAEENKVLADRLRETLETLTSGFVMLDAQWRFTYVNREAERMAGRSRQSLLGRILWEEIPGIAGSEFETEYRRAMRDRTPVQVESYHAAYERWFEVRAYPTDDGGLALYIHDVTERHRALERLEQSERRFESIALATTDMIWDCDPQTGDVWRSSGRESTYGHDEASYPPTLAGWAALVHPEDRPRVESSLHQALASEATKWAAEYRFRRGDGRYAIVSDRASIQRDAAGNAVRMLGGMTDITERRELERLLMRTQRLDSLGTLAGGIAHDLNNVFTPITMGLNLLDEGPMSPDERTILGSVRLGAARGAEMVKQLLSFARGMEGQRVEVQPRLVVHELERMIRDTFPRNIEIAARISGRLPTVAADPTQLHQVLLNLCVNARDAMPGGGHLVLRVRQEHVPSAMRSVNGEIPPGHYVRIAVEDTGCGIEEAMLDRIFDPFFTTKRHGEGTGLGLSTTLAILRRHGGHLQVRSKPGAGSCFTVLLPVREPAAPAPAPPAPAALRRGAGQTILLVDDEPAIRELARRALRKAGYEVLVAGDGREALAALRDAAPVEVIVTDIMMPGMDGHSLIRALAERHPAPAVICTSGIPGPEYEAQWKRANCTFLPKPYTPEKLLLAVQDALDRVTSA